MPTSDAPDERAADPRWQLVERVAASAMLRRARRLRELLLFLGERAIRGPQQPPSEPEIAARVFGRATGFDPSSDTLVRVHVSQLRRRLQQYFSSEGAAEAVIIVLPTGSYLPAFVPRESPRPAAGPADAAAARRLLLLLTASLAAAVAVGAWQFLTARELARRLDGGEPRPAAHELWRGMFGAGRTRVVVCDSTLALFQDLVGHQLSLPEYQNGQFNTIAEKRLEREADRYMARRLMTRQFTSAADARLAERLARLAAPHGPTEVLHARQVEIQHFQNGGNVLLSGPRRANPWLELFEERLNFRTRFEEATRRVSFVNAAPQADEEPSYAGSWISGGYCRVAFLPNLDRTGGVLILSGTDMPATDAGVELITHDRWVRLVWERLGVVEGRPLPHFEVLLRTRRVAEAASDFEIVAHRVYGTAGGPAAN